MSYYDARLVEGLQYQDWITQLMLRRRGLAILQCSSKAYQLALGESFTGIEVKYDSIVSSSNKLWIELYERSSDDRAWVPSGILRRDNTWGWIQGDYRQVYFFAKKDLIEIWHAHLYEHVHNTRDTSIGLLLPVTAAALVCLFAESIDENDPERIKVPVSRDGGGWDQVRQQAGSVFLRGAAPDGEGGADPPAAASGQVRPLVR